MVTYGDLSVFATEESVSFTSLDRLARGKQQNNFLHFFIFSTEMIIEPFLFAMQTVLYRVVITCTFMQL